MFIDIAFASPEVAEATEQAGEAGLLASLGINGSLLIFQLLNFAVVVAIIWFLILKPLTKKMAERQAIIDQSLENAKKVEENLHKSERKYQERVDLSKVEANKILEKAAGDAEKVADDMKNKSKKEIELLIDQAKRNIKIERDEMMSEIKQSAAELLTLAVEKILKEKLDEKRDGKLIDEALAGLR